MTDNTNHLTEAPFSSLADWEKELVYSQALTTVENLRENIAELRIERDEARNRQNQAVLDHQRNLLSSLEDSLKEFAEEHLLEGSDEYKALSELMTDNGMSGLKRTFNVTVRVSYEFEVEIDAEDEDEARDIVDSDITTYAQDYVMLQDTPDDLDIDVTEA